MSAQAGAKPFTQSPSSPNPARPSPPRCMWVSGATRYVLLCRGPLTRTSESQSWSLDPQPCGSARGGHNANFPLSSASALVLKESDPSISGKTKRIH